MEKPRSPATRVPAVMVASLIAASTSVRAEAPLPHLQLVRYEVSPLNPADPLTLAVRACVDSIRQFDYASADRACDRAVDAATHEHFESGSALPWARSGLVKGEAIAHMNRAVLRYLEHDLPAARSDIVHARALAPSDPLVLESFAVLSGSEPALAKRD